MSNFFDLISDEEKASDRKKFYALHKKAQESIIEKYGRLLTEDDCIKWTEEAKKKFYHEN